jgi:hemoglobin-like flavoprotein
MGLNAELLETSFSQVAPRASEFAVSFYNHLWTDNPQSKELFANSDMESQRKKLIQSLVLVVDNLRKPDVLTEALHGLGARHVKYGVLPTHYPMVGGAILKTFEEYLGPSWTPEVKQAWVDAYGAITQLMLEGADYPEEVLTPHGA